MSRLRMLTDQDFPEYRTAPVCRLVPRQVRLEVTLLLDLRDVDRLIEIAATTGRSKEDVIATGIRGLYRALHG